MNRLKIAIQKKGRLSEQSLRLLRECGIRISNGGKLKAEATNFPVDVLYLRDDDIPQYVADGVADVGILGENVVLEKGKKVRVAEKLGFARCRLSLAVKREEKYVGLSWLNGKKIASTYPNILRRFLEEQGIAAGIEEISGSVEIAPGIGLADAVCDIVSTGSTLMMNGLREVETILRSEAVLIANPSLEGERQKILGQLRFRIRAVQNAGQYKYILLNAPDDSLETICALLPGMKSPTILPLAEKGWNSVHSVVKEDTFWEVIDNLRQAGAQGILVCPIEKMFL